MQAKQTQYNFQKRSNRPHSNCKIVLMLLMSLSCFACEQEESISTVSRNDSEVSGNDRNTDPADGSNTDPADGSNTDPADGSNTDHADDRNTDTSQANQLTPLNESRILTTTTEQQLVVINPINGEVQPLAYSGLVSRLSLAPVTAGNRIGVILADGRETENNDAENNYTETNHADTTYRFLVLNQNLEVLANHSAPSELTPCLTYTQKLVPLDSDGDRFLVLCGQESKERTHVIIFGDDLEVTPLPEQHNYIGLPFDDTGESLPLMTRVQLRTTFSVFNTLTGEITATGEHELWNDLPRIVLPQDDEGLIYIADGGENNFSLDALDIRSGFTAHTIEGSQNLIRSGGWHRESELLNGRVVLTTEEGVLVIDTQSEEVFRAGNLDWPTMSRVSPNGQYALLAFPHKLERHDLESGEVVTLEAPTDGPWYQDGGGCVYGVDTLNFAPTGDTALLSSKGTHVSGACPAIPELSFADSPYSLVVKTQNPENPIVLQDAGSLAPRYAPNGSSLAYFRASQDDCMQLYLTHVVDATEENLAEDNCFNNKTIEWLSLPTR